jgi:hypothetical protein
MARAELSGYSTQAKISLRVAELVHHSRIDLWFSREFNPIDNEPGSNPLKIFEELDRASKEGARGAKTRSARKNLVKRVPDLAGRGEIEDSILTQATAAVGAALESAAYGPAVPRLKPIDCAARRAEPGEYRASGRSLRQREHLRQLLPPADCQAV